MSPPVFSAQGLTNFIPLFSIVAEISVWRSKREFHTYWFDAGNQ